MKTLGRTAAIAATSLATLALAAAPGFAGGDHATAEGAAQARPAHYDQGHGGGARGQYGPGMMGQGYHMGPGTMMGPGMMGPGYQSRPGTMQPPCPGFEHSTLGPGKELTVGDVRARLERSLTWHGNKRLKVGEVKQADNDKIVADITTVDGSLVQRLEVDRHTGQMRDIE